MSLHFKQKVSTPRIAPVLEKTQSQQLIQSHPDNLTQSQSHVVLGNDSENIDKPLSKLIKYESFDPFMAEATQSNVDFANDPTQRGTDDDAMSVLT